MDGGGIGKGKGCKRDGVVEGLEFETNFFWCRLFILLGGAPSSPTNLAQAELVEMRIPVRSTIWPAGGGGGGGGGDVVCIEVVFARFRGRRVLICRGW